MRTVVFAIIAAVLGVAVGYLRSNQDGARFEHIVGEDINMANLTAAERLVTAELGTAPTMNKSGEAIMEAIPKVEVIGGRELNFGTMKQGTERNHAFQFKNTGNAPLTLKVLRSTCKCTIGTLEKSVLEPGETAGVKLTWRAEGVLNDFEQTATIETNDPRQLEVQLVIKGKIGKNYIFPDQISLGEFSARDTLTKEFDFFSCEETPLLIDALWGNSDETHVKISQEIRKVKPDEFPEYADARSVAHFKLEITPGMIAGPINTQVRLSVGAERTPISIRCTGKCVSDLRIVAGSDYDDKMNWFNVGKFASSEGGSKSFFIAARHEPDKEVTLKLKRITPENTEESFNVVIGEPSKKTNSQTIFPVKIVIPPGATPISRGGTTPQNYVKLFFETNLEVGNEISLFLKVIVDE